MNFNPRFKELPDLYARGAHFVLIVHEHHGNRYLDAYTLDNLLISSAKVLKDRVESGHYPEIDKLEEWMDIPIPPKYSKESIPSLPGDFQEAATEKWKDYEREVKHYESQTRLAEFVQKALNDNTGRLAYVVLTRDSGYEDRVDLQRLEEIEKAVLTES